MVWQHGRNTMQKLAADSDKWRELVALEDATRRSVQRLLSRAQINKMDVRCNEC